MGWGLMFDCMIIVILRNIEIMICSPLYELVWLGMEWGCWVRVIMVCCSCLIVISWGAFV